MATLELRSSGTDGMGRKGLPPQLSWERWDGSKVPIEGLKRPILIPSQHR